MTFFTQMAKRLFLLVPFIGLGLMANAQSATVTVTNNTSCEVYIEVYGSSTAGACHLVTTKATGVVAANSTSVLAYNGSGTYFNVGATSVYSGSVPHPNAPYGTWAWAVHPLQTCPGAINDPGDSPCGGYFLSINAAGNVAVN